MTATPRKTQAKRIKKITFKDAIARHLQFMDTAALAICLENKVPVQVFNLHKKGNIKRAVCGEDIGTLIY